MSEFRQDPITGRWAIVAENRSARPNEFAAPPSGSPPGECPFCEGHESWTPPEVAADRGPGVPSDGPGWTVRAIPNKFPTLAPGTGSSAEEAGAADGERRPGSGVHEVIIVSPRHAPALANHPPEQVRRVLRILRERLRTHERGEEFAALLAFENSGPESGGTLFHPHLQIVALPQVPPLLQEEAGGLARFARENPGSCGYEWVEAGEREHRVRVVSDGPELFAFAPFASEHPFEVRILPHRHAGSFAEASAAEVKALSELLPAILRALRAVAPNASYNLVTRSFSRHRPEHREYHWHLDLLPRLVRPDGFEMGGGIAVNPVSPESAAEALRDALERPEAAAPSETTGPKS
jgi:UDPglucose--hexose-1-phosphate uridylyltransferase